MLATEVVLLPMVAFLFHAPLFARPLLLAALLGLGTIGFASVGTLFAAMLVRTRSRDVLLPILLYPITVPVIIAGVRGTSALAAGAAGRGDRDAVDRPADGLRRGVRDAGVVDVRTADDGVERAGRLAGEKLMRKLFIPLVVVAAAMFAYAPVAHRQRSPYESTMLLVQKIFYFHFATWMAVTASVTVCGIASAIYLFKGTPAADRYAVASAELTTIFCLFGLFSGSLWGRKAWGVWWQWDARLTMAFMLELVFLGYLLVRKYGGPGAEKLAAAMGIFGAATAPFIYKSVDWWRTIHPQTSVMKTLGRQVSGRLEPRLVLLGRVSAAVRRRCSPRACGSKQLRAELDRVYLAAEE